MLVICEGIKNCMALNYMIDMGDPYCFHAGFHDEEECKLHTHCEYGVKCVTKIEYDLENFRDEKEKDSSP